MQEILTGQVASIDLITWALLAYFHFLPSILAFLRGHRGFLIILPLNILVSPIHSEMLNLFFREWTAHSASAEIFPWGPLLFANYGPVWIALMIWSLRPVSSPDPRFLAAQDTKLYDMAAALPLILWYAYGTLQLRPRLVFDAVQIIAGAAQPVVMLRFCALFAAAAFNLVLIYLLVVRDKPVWKSRGVLPRVTAFAGTFLGVGILQLPVADLSLVWQVVASILVLGGCAASALVLAKLGKSFSIMPEARKLVTDGPYAYARHPLYAVELITIAGTAIQFQQPWATLLALVVVALIYARTVFEEQVLTEAYPEYAAYRMRVKRFMPGVI